MIKLKESLIYSAVVLVLLSVSFAQAGIEPSQTTQVVILGSGTPLSDPERSGPGVAIVVNDTPYIVDFGPGIVRRAAAMSPTYGGSIKGLEVSKITRAFSTHLHSDHTTGFPDLIFTPWTMGRDEPLEVYGPEGIVEMTDNLLKTYEEDIRYRLYSLEPANNQGWRVNAHAVEEGVVYRDENVKVEAFKVRHGTWPIAYGYRFTTPDRVIVVSGDSGPSENIEKYSRDADILIHEVYSSAGLENESTFWRSYHEDNHTSALELGEIASRTKPKLLVLYHILYFGHSADEILSEVRLNFGGDVVAAEDLDVY